MLPYLLNLPDPAVDAVLQLVQEARVVQLLSEVGHLRLPALVGALLDHLVEAAEEYNDSIRVTQHVIARTYSSGHYTSYFRHTAQARDAAFKGRHSWEGGMLQLARKTII